MKKAAVLLCLLFCLPRPAGAVQEDVVQAAPEAAQTAGIDAVLEDYTPEAYAQEYAAGGDEDWEGHMQAPRLTKKEAARVPALQARYDAGERPEESALGVTQDVVVGVYPLRPQDYAGETVYVILPTTYLTDEQLLQLIDAFSQIGKRFDPAALSHRNCMRGGYFGNTRYWTDSERTRADVLRGLYRQGVQAQPFTVLPQDDGLGRVTLQTQPEDLFCGRSWFTFLPYRAMDDAELFAYVTYDLDETEPREKRVDWSGMEAVARAEMARLVGAPLALKRVTDYTLEQFTVSDTVAEGGAYCGQFESDPTAGRYVRTMAIVENATKETLNAYCLYIDANLRYSDLRLDPFDEKWRQMACAAVSDIRPDCRISHTQALGEQICNGVSGDVSSPGYGALVAVYPADGGYYEVKILYQSEQVVQIEYSRKPPVLPKEQEEGASNG